jgi:hypothetical protein
MARRLPLLLALLVLETDPAVAASHLWRFREFYSSPDRSVQFIVMQEIGGSEIETNISGHWFATDGYNQNHSQMLGTDLPFGTANKQFLVGTQSYAALPGVPAPDYVLPDGFLDPTGDTVVWWFYQTIVIPPGIMPTDGAQSLHVVNPAVPGNPPVYSVGVNSPTNFAGDTGTVALAVPSLSVPGAALLVAVSAWAQTRRRAQQAVPASAKGARSEA